MAELVAASTAIGIASSFVTFIDVGWRVVKRFNEYKEAAKDTPNIIIHVAAQLPVIINKIEDLKKSTEEGSRIGPGSDVAVAVARCCQEISKLDSISAKLLPSAADSKWRTAKKAVRSVKYEKEINASWTVIQSYLATFTFHLKELDVAIREIEKSPPKPSFTVPFVRDRNYVSRSDVLGKIKAALSSSTRVALAGIGGAGKSQIAIEYSYIFKEEYPDRHIFWVHAGSPERFEQAYTEIARRHSIRGWDDPKADKVNLVFEWLNESDVKWLMILDNSDDLKTFYEPVTSPATNQASRLLVDYIPTTSNGSILITTRDKVVGETLSLGEPSILIEAMEYNEAQALLLSKIPEASWSGSEFDDLLRDLEYLPLAITQAAAFIRHKSLTVSAYRSLFDAEDTEMRKLLSEELLDPRRDSKSQNSITRTLKLSFDQIATSNPHALEILSLIAMLDRNSVPILLLQRDDVGLVDFTTAVGTLQAFSLITAEKNGIAFTMHRLVQVSVQQYLDLQSNLLHWQQKALSLIHNKLPKWSFENSKTYEIMMPHIQAVLAYDLSSLSSFQDSLLLSADVFDSVSEYESTLGKYESALVHSQTALDIRRKQLGEEDKGTLLSMCNVASAYCHDGQYETAVTLQEQVLEMYKKVLGDEDLGTIGAMYQLGHSYFRLDRLNEAARMQEDALELFKRVVGIENEYTAGAIVELGSIYCEQGYYDKGVLLQQQALEIHKRVLGSEHPDTLLNMCYLGSTYRLQGQYDEAVVLHEQVLDICKRELGNEHPYTLTSLSHLAATYRDQGGFDKAVVLHEQEYEIRKRLFGNEHPETITALGHLAVSYRDQGDFDKAVVLHEQEYEIRKRLFGNEHPYTILALGHLAVSYRDQGDFDKAVVKQEQEYEIRKRLVGNEHPDTILSLGHLAAAYHSQGHYNKAAMLHQELLEMQTRIFGKEHSRTITSLLNLGACQYDLGNYKKALTILEQAHEGFKILLGPDHPHTINADGWVKRTYTRQERATNEDIYDQNE